jgi:RHS repeat-associated protein
MRTRIFYRSAVSRSIAALAAVATLLPLRIATSAPGDIFTTAAPAIGDAAPAAAGIADGELGVSSSTGAFTYAYAIAGPPGRSGMQPNISLSYSSQAPIYGGLAAGWSLSGLPIITEDTNSGRLGSSVQRFQSSLSGNRPLIPVTEPASSGATTYRAQNDTSWMRYERYANADYWWRALSPDGRTYYFGNKDQRTSTCTIVSAGYAPLTRIEDASGNQIDFYYQPGVEGECRIAGILWGHNPNASIGPSAAMQFFYANYESTACAPVGAQTSYRTGTKIVSGASQLQSIMTAAIVPTAMSPGTLAPPPTSPPVHTRTITLSYSATTSSCSAQHAPFRALTSIQESAVGIDSPQVNLPPIQFAYNSAAIDYGGYQSAVQTAVPWATSALGGPGPGVYNLSWGHRPNTGWPSVEAMMLDVDGDGLIDRVQSEPSRDANGRVQFCRARWYRNRGAAFTGTSQFQLAGDINIPTLKWSTPVGTPGGAYAGGPYAASDPALGTQERCSLNHQRTAYRNSTVSALTTCPPSATACPVGPDNIGVCSGTKSDCGVGKNAASETHFAWRWMDIDGDQLPDLVGSPATGGVGSYDLQRGNDFNPPLPPQEPTIFGTFPNCPSPPYSGSNDWTRDHYTMCRGMFPWFVYKNHGNGVFGQARPGGSGTTHATWGPLPDEIIYQPVSLESSNGDSSVTSSPVGQFEATVDVDGDGFVDSIQVFNQPANQWKVYRNNGTGRMVPSSGTSPYPYETNFYLFPSRTDYPQQVSTAPSGVEGLLDLNGDGLVDQWRANANSAQASIHYNEGIRFRASGTLPVADRPGTDGVAQVSASTFSNYVCKGKRDNSRSTHDVDKDGRADIVRFNGATIPTVQYNFGGKFGSPILQIGPGALHSIQVSSDNDLSPCEGNGWWETLSSLVDLDGDGVEEDVLFTSVSGPPSQMQVRYPNNATASRLLVSINNNRGATTSIAYASMNSATVTQTPAPLKSSPATNWVVQSVTTTDTVSSTTNTSTYKYKNPRWSKDPHSPAPTPASFRGFEEVESTSQSGAVTVERFSYSPDWSGRLATKMVKPSSATSVHTIDDTTWEARTLFGGAITTYHATASDHWTCRNGQTEAGCRGNTETRTRSETVLTALGSTSTSDPTQLLWVASTDKLQGGTTLADGDRQTVSTYALYSSASSYRLRTLTTTKNHRVAGTWQLYDKSAATWDSARGLQLTSEQWIDGVDANRLITTNTYDALGNLETVTDPRGNTIVNEYDIRKLFVAAVNNEYYAHHYEYEYEYGTGSRLVTRGPDWAYCATHYTPFCPNDPTLKLRNEERVRVDGLGRVIERFESVNRDPNLMDYALEKTEMHSYADNTVPNSATRQTAIDKTGSTIRYRSETTQFDGLGRPVRTAVAGAPAEHVTTYTYAADGTLRFVSVPDPTPNASPTALVTYTYGFDTLGRPTSIRRPDATAAASQSGVNIAYNGLVSTTTEVVGAAGGQVGETQTVNDRYGRLQQVKEKTAAGAYATTTYLFDPDDNVANIVDPQGLTTTLVHDFGGRRTAITRGGRTWRYGYDRNGNQTSITTPCTPDPTCRAAHTTTISFDPLNRETSRLIAPRTMSLADRTLFSADTELRVYDYGANSRDRVVQWFAYAPGSTATTQFNWINYDARGNRLMNWQWFQNAGYPMIRRDVMYDYHLSDQVKFARYRENDGEFPIKRVSYDDRGLVANVDVSFDRGATWPNQPTVHTRNVAGLVTKRRTDVVGGPISFVESNWTYDSLGRVTDQTIQKSGPTPVARQMLTYFGNDDVKTLQHFLGVTSRTFTYGYDLRHQITGVSTNTSTYFGATYQYGIAGRLTRATHTRTISPTPAGADPRLVRNVNYVYSGIDPEQVTALTNVSNGSNYATYTYDLAGNQVTRSYPATNELFEYTYDGQDQLRRVVRKVNGVVQGSEEYWYGLDGNRTQVVKRDAAGNRTELVWFLDDVEAHYATALDGTVTLTKTYSHVSEGTPIARIERTGPTTATTKIEYQFHGLANNTLAAVAKDGTINASFSYAPFGEILESTNGGGAASGASVHRRRLNDKYEDDVSGLAYYGFRFYDKTLLGWTQADPLYRFRPDATWTTPRKGNLYAFTIQNSLRYLDPDGRFVFALIPALVEGVAAFVAAGTTLGAAVPLAAAVGTAGTAAELDSNHPHPSLELLEHFTSPPPSGPSIGAAEILAVGTLALAGPFAAPAPLTMGDRDKITPPSWVGGLRPLTGEKAQAFAKRVLDAKYGSGGWKGGPGSEYSVIVKWVHRSLRGGGALALIRKIKESDAKAEKAAPADLNQDGSVEEEEESAWMRMQQ